MIHTATAPTKARKLVKSALFNSRQIQAASKAEAAGTAGATVERERITASFARDLTETDRAIKDTRQHAAALDRGALLLRTQSRKAHSDDPVARLGGMTLSLTELQT